MIEDSEDKLRRNLLVFAAAILGTVFLQPKLAHNGQILGFIDTKDVDPLRAWVVVTSVLVYLAYRYWCSTARQLTWGSQRDAAYRLANLRLASVLGDTITRQYAGEDMIHTLPNSKPLDAAKRRKVSTIHVTFPQTIFKPEGEATFNATFIEGMPLQSDFKYTVAGKRSRWIHSVAMVRAMIQTGTLAELCLPFAFGIMAGAVCISQLWERWPWVFVKPW